MDKIERRNRRKKSIRKKISGTDQKPRMCVHKSNKNIYVQLIDDVEGKTLCGVSTKNVDMKDAKDAKTRKNIKFAEALGTDIAKFAIEKGIKKVVFDRAGYLYHGVVKTIADAARKGGLEF
ncbi:MAG: 50S ribosomal protein L18 [Candidatus Omnitrophica bacterium]|nr:50S ribosomal protein L18 [Candidatus Omnitrophota bacterium]